MGHIFLNCTTCGLPLSNPVSQELGQGPVCRIGAKNRTMNMESLFANRASYTWGFLRPRKSKHTRSIIWIEDQDNGKSVTNDIGNVIEDIHKELQALRKEDTIDNYLLMYRDTRGVWDAIDLKPWSGVGTRRLFLTTIYSLKDSRNREDGAERLWDAHYRQQKPEVTEE